MVRKLSLFAKDATERVVSTAAQATLALITADQISSAFELDWKAVAGVAGLAGLAALLKALAALKLTDDSVSPASLVQE